MDPNQHDYKPSASILSQLINWFNSNNNRCSLVPVAVSALITTGCLCVLAYKYNCQEKSTKCKKEGGRILSRCTSIGLLHGGNLAVKRLIVVHNVLTDVKSLELAESHLRTLLDKENHDLRTLQNMVVKLEMSGKEEKAISMLKQAKEKAERLRKNHEAHEIEMLIVEMLIYQGKHKEAMGCKCLFDEEISDARRPLYKAISLVLEGKKEEAIILWKKFRKIRENFKSSYDIEGLALNDVPNDFDKFVNAVYLLKEQIRDAKNSNSKNKNNINNKPLSMNMKNKQ